MDDEGKTFEEQIVVFERNPILHAVSIALLVLGPIAFVAALTQLFPPGFLGVHATIVGLAIFLTQQKHNRRARRNRRYVRATRDGIFAEGKLVVARDKIADGFFQPRLITPENEYASSVRVVDKRRTILFEAELDEHEALRFLRTLGLDPASRRAEFRGGSPFFSTVESQVATVFVAMGLAVMLALLGDALTVNLLPLGPVAMVLVVGAGLVPSKITVGVDGLLVRWLWTTKFIPMSEVRDVVVADDNAVRVYLKSGRVEVLYTSVRHKNASAESMHANRDAILARIREALATYHQRGTAVDATALVARGSRSRSEWFEALEKLGRETGGYREAALRSEDLLRVIEDPTAPADARAGAALVLQKTADDGTRARVRVAAEASASPKLRVALDAAAGGAAEELREAIGELAEDDEARA